MPLDPLIPLLLTRTQAAKALAVCERTVDALIRAGELRAVRVGRAVRLERADLEHFIANKKAAVTSGGTNKDQDAHIIHNIPQR